MELGWEFPTGDQVKVNVHAVHYDQPLPNGNTSGLGVVVRDSAGEIIVMVSGSIQHLNARANELWAMLLGLRCCFYEKKNNVILETESAEAVREWENWRWFVDPRHMSVIQSLNKRRSDENLNLHVSLVGESKNMLARYLAEDGALHRSRPVVFRRQFGRVREIWHRDMGLGTVAEGFDLVEEADYIKQHGGAQVEGMGEWLAADGESSVQLLGWAG